MCKTRDKNRNKILDFPIGTSLFITMLNVFCHNFSVCDEIIKSYRIINIKATDKCSHVVAAFFC